MIAALVILAIGLAQGRPAALTGGPAAPDCQKLMVAEPTGDIATLCAGEAAMRLAANAAAGSQERFQHLREAAAQYSRAAELLKNLELKIYAYEAVVRVHDASNLNEPAGVEPALRNLATLVAGTPAPLMRLAKFQEDHEAADAAEHTLLGARQQYPDSLALLRVLSAFFARRAAALLPRWGTAAAPGPPQPQPKPAAYRPDCRQFSFGDPTSGLAQLCTAEAEMRKGVERTRAAAERTQHLRAAAERYSRAAEILREIEAKTYAYEALANVYAAANLNEPREAEEGIRHLMALAPDSTAPILRLASFQEQQKLVDAAEITLLNARPQHPGDVELLRALWKFYERLASAAQLTEFGRERESDKPVPGQPDANGFYAMGGNVRAPKATQESVPLEYPKEAQALGIEGSVVLEVRVDEAGQVIDARVVRSIPLLDDAAVAAAKRWRFEPAVIDGRPVPVILTMEMSFSQRRQPGK
jgi:TonB family protein